MVTIARCESAKNAVRETIAQFAPMGDPRFTSLDPVDLGRLAEQLSAIADQLRTPLSTSESQHDTEPIDALFPSPTLQISKVASAPLVAIEVPNQRTSFAKKARSAYSERRQRNAIFGTDEIFGEPAWDILLDLYVAYAEKKSVSVSSACIGSASPSTTGLRWLGVLSDIGFIKREHDPDDQRRVLVRLSNKGLAAMDRYFEVLSPAL